MKRLVILSMAILLTAGVSSGIDKGKPVRRVAGKTYSCAFVPGRLQEDIDWKDTIVSFDGNHTIKDEDLRFLAKMPKLMFIDVGDSSLTIECLKMIKKLPQNGAIIPGTEAKKTLGVSVFGNANISIEQLKSDEVEKLKVNCLHHASYLQAFSKLEEASKERDAKEAGSPIVK